MIKIKNKTLIFILLGILALMTVGYAAFQTNLNIKGISKINSNWDIRITSVTESNKTGGAKEIATPKWSDLTVSIDVELNKKGDSIEYDVTVENRGTIDATLNDIEENIKNQNEVVLISISGYTKGEKLLKNTSQIIKVKVEYNPDFTGTPEEGNTETDITLSYTQAQGGTVTPTNDYLLAYDYATNGGSNTTGTEYYVAETEEVDLSPIAEKEGYEFVGWNTNKDATIGLTELQMPSKDTILYAIYKKQLQVTYQKGDNVASINKESDNCYLYNKETTCEITLPQISANNGYIGIGWYKGEEKVGDANQKHSITENTNLTSRAKLNAYTLTYNYNGATGGNTVSSKTVEYQKPYGTLPTPTRSYVVTYNYNGATGGNTTTSTSSNYTFNGWYKESTLTTKINSTDIYILTTNSTIYASWTSSKITLPTPTKTGYTFNGWYSDSGLTKKVGDAGAKYTPSANITLYAKWVDNIKPTVSLNPNTQTTYVKSKAVTVNLADAGSGLKASQNIYYAWSTSNTTAPSYSSYVTTTNAAGAKTAAVTVPATSNSSLTGSYYLWIKVGTLSDVAGNTSAVKTSAVFKFDNTKPTVSLNPNTQATYVKSKAVTVNLADSHSGLKASQKIYYAWSTSNTTAPSYSTYVTTTNAAGATSASVAIPATSNSSLTGSYYLWIKVGTLSDVAGNTSVVKTSAVFKFDNTAPTITASNNSGSNWTFNSIKISGSASDGHSGVNASTYQYTYNKSTTYNDWDSTSTSAYSGTWAAARNAQVFVRVADNLGNWSAWKDAGYVRIFSALKTGAEVWGSVTYTSSGNSGFQVGSTIRETSKSASQVCHQWYCQAYVAKGNFNGTSVSNNWGNTFTMNGVGYYAKSGWQNYATYCQAYGTRTNTCIAYYYASSKVEATATASMSSSLTG